MKLPNGLQDVASVAGSNGPVNVMGVVVDFLPPCETKGADWQCTFSIADAESSSEGQRVKIFTKAASMPQIRDTGDVIILRCFFTKDYNGMKVLLSNWRSQWTVFQCCTIPEEPPVNGPLHIEHASNERTQKPTEQEMRYAIELCNMRSRHEWSSKDIVAGAPPTGPAVSGVATTSYREKFSLIEDVGSTRNYDLVGQVVKMYPIAERLDLYITDYTEHSLLYNYGGADDIVSDDRGRDGDQYGYLQPKPRKQPDDWKGPAGRYTLTVTLFPPHASYAESKLRLGDYALLKNVYVKLGKDPSSCRLEGVIHTDKRFPERINVEKVTAESDKRVKELLKKKKDYLIALDDGTAGAKSSKDGRKRKRNDDGGKKLSKAQKRLSSKKASKSATNEKATANNTTEPAKRSINPVNAALAALLEPNKHVVAAHPDQPVRSVQEVNSIEKTHSYQPSGSEEPIILPYQNVIFRTKVRVVDFQPSSIEDFAVRTSEFDALSDAGGEDVCGSGSNPTPPSPPSSPSCASDAASDTPRRKRWTWFFTLLLEDATTSATKSPNDRIAVHIADEDAEFLLNLDAANLRQKPKLLAQLREKLFLLWGELEERKLKQKVLCESSGNSGNMAEGGNGTNEASNGGAAEAKKHAPASKPFVCCVKEYGVKSKGEWQRRFRIFGTSIQ